MKNNFAIIILFFALLFYTCNESKEPSKSQAEKAIKYAFEDSKIIWLGINRSYDGKVEIHDIKGYKDEPVNAVKLGISPDSVSLIQAKSEKEGVFISSATLVYEEYIGEIKLPQDTVGAIFTLFKEGNEWRAFPLSQILKIKK